jgi:IMP dehydrogenase
VPEGIEGRVAYKGSAQAVIYQLVGGIRAGMGYSGSATIPELQQRAKLIRITPAGMREPYARRHDHPGDAELPNRLTPSVGPLRGETGGGTVVTS